MIPYDKEFCITMLYDWLNNTLHVIYITKLLDSDWLRAVQFKCNTSANVFVFMFIEFIRFFSFNLELQFALVSFSKS